MAIVLHIIIYTHLLCTLVRIDKSKNQRLVFYISLKILCLYNFIISNLRANN